MDANSDICPLLTFANSLDPDQDRQNVRPDLDPNPLNSNSVVLEWFFGKADFLKKVNNKSMKNYVTVSLHVLVIVLCERILT